ncbi:MAG: hypothetical protein JO078_08160 [Candidatus Eremiobacteraeota bacterium]|nr:hypothetical protein [Candidatus Eremiobacteraeota bacterium]MBV9700084.1 hypothetical protein [Candidatus Eremiobacteraeota bacterium]
MTSHLDVIAMREDRGRFARRTGTNVLVYWPHGFGDWVHFGGIAPLLEPSNRYAITRFGDDYVSVLDGCNGVTPLYSGERSPGDGSAMGAPHFGLRLRDCNGRRRRIAVAQPLGDAVECFAPEILLWTDYPETEGRTAFPFHTKARNLVRHLVAPDRLKTAPLFEPLKNAIDFTPSPEVLRIVDERLSQFAPPGTRLCVVSTTGITASRKNWGDGHEARDFVSMLRARSHRWRVLSMDDETVGDAVFRRVFASIEQPFARVFKALAARTDLFIGIPSGPLHFVLARGGIPTVGLWLAHHPDWYDEPNADAIHLIGNYVRERGFDRRPATLTKPPSHAHRVRYVAMRTMEARDVMAAADALTT